MAPIFDKNHADFGQLFPLMTLEHMKIVHGNAAMVAAAAPIGGSTRANNTH